MKVKKLSIISIIMGMCIASIPAVAQAATPLVLTTGNCPTSLTVNATLKSNVTCDETININSANITLNLNGYTLGTNDGNVINVNASGFTLTGGTIKANNDDRGVYSGIYSTINITKVNFIGDCRGCNVIGLFLSRVAQANVSNSKFSALSVGLFSEISNVKLSTSTFDNTDTGFDSNADTVATVTGSSFTNSNRGIWAENTGSLNISKSNADDNYEQGMLINSNGDGVVNINSSYARNNGTNGIQVYNSRFWGKTSSIINTVASGNGDNGFFLIIPGIMTFKGNLANYNGNVGVYVADNYGINGPVSASYNAAGNNGNWGFYADTVVAGIGNTATGNNGDGVGRNCYGFVCKK